VAKSLRATFSAVQACIYFARKWVGPHLGRFFDKLIRSPWPALARCDEAVSLPNRETMATKFIQIGSRVARWFGFKTKKYQISWPFVKMYGSFL
jgi:hypothetical protein